MFPLQFPQSLRNPGNFKHHKMLEKNTHTTVLNIFVQIFHDPHSFNKFMDAQKCTIN